ncbi:MAG TPA: PAS domain S-box protein [Candidatus Dormibacteraeota bacterium]|nr:PAS domain S-box protein [Candidatus Dormibacteraeota bacterium]
MLANQGLLGIAFFEATASIILLVLFLLFRRDHHTDYFRYWLTGWCCLTFSSLCEVALLIRQLPGLYLASVLAQAAALLLFLVAVVHCSSGSERRIWSPVPLIGLVLAAIYYIERRGPQQVASLHWETAIFETALCLLAGWMMWRSELARHSHGAQLLAGIFLMSGLHGLDRPLWPDSPLFLLRVAFDHFMGMALGIAMVVVVLEGARTRSEELNDKMHRLTLLTAASTQTLSVQEVIEQVLSHLVESLGATHGIVRLRQGEGSSAQLVARAWVGFDQSYLTRYAQLSAMEPWAQRVLKGECQFLESEEEWDPKARKRVDEAGLKTLVTLPLPGKQGPLGVIAVGSTRQGRFHPDELSYLVNIANLLGLTLQNVSLFEQVTAVQRQWEYTFDSIGDPILVHDRAGRILRSNQRLSQLLGREGSALVGRSVMELLPVQNAAYKSCPYCEGIGGEGDNPDPWLPGYFLASNSTFTDPSGLQLGTVHVLKDITDRKRAEEKYRTLISSVQEGVFISTPQGRFLDFNDALLRMTGYEDREELLEVDIPAAFYANSSDRERLKKLLQQHGKVADFEFEMRRKDGEIRFMLESSIAVRDAAGNVTAYQGFLLDITERKQAEHEIRRRNRELLVLNSIGQTLTESLDLSDSLHRTLRQMAELFNLDATSLYLFDQNGTQLRRIAAVGHRSEFSRRFPPVSVNPELMQHIKAVHATFLSAQGLSLPPIFRDVQLKEAIVDAYVVVLWSKDRVIGGLVVGSRAPREFSAADVNLLIAVGSQFSSAIERSILYEETRLAYENLRRTQEQLLHSEKLAAVGQLISGVAHELNNPLTAILGYSQLLTSSGQMGQQGIEYADKLYKQAQRTHRIVQNLLSFARQHKPERVPVQINQTLEETLALRDYDLRMHNVRIHLDLAENFPVTSADPHQLQQVFLNMVNNAVDAILEHSTEGDIWVRTALNGDRLCIEITDSGPGVKDASRVFDPFYTTKPVGKGTGLGLSICYGIITEHGGTIRVRNIPARGASFTVELPFQPMASPVSSTPGQGAISGRDGRILLVDHDDSVLEAVGTILRGRDHRVQTAKDIREARALLEKQDFDLIVADLHVSDGANGGGLGEWLAQHKPALSRKLIWMCAVAPSEDAGENIAGNGRQILQKPFKASDLLAAVDELLLNNVQTAAIDR